MKIHISFLLPTVLVTIAVSCCLMTGCLFGGTKVDSEGVAVTRTVNWHPSAFSVPVIDGYKYLIIQGDNIGATNSYEWVNANTIKFIAATTGREVICCGGFRIENQVVAEKPHQ